MTTPLTIDAARVQLARLKATFRGSKDGVQWYWVNAGGYWVGLYVVPGGYALKRAERSACNC